MDDRQVRASGLLGAILEERLAMAVERDHQLMAEALGLFPEFQDEEVALEFFGAVPPEKIGQIWVPDSRAIN